MVYELLERNFPFPGIVSGRPNPRDRWLVWYTRLCAKSLWRAKEPQGGTEARELGNRPRMAVIDLVLVESCVANKCTSIG